MINPVQEIVQIYTELRKRGASATDALEKLRARIESLSRDDQTEVVRLVRQTETTLKSDKRGSIYDTFIPSDSKPTKTPVPDDEDSRPTSTAASVPAVQANAGQQAAKPQAAGQKTPPPKMITYVNGSPGTPSIGMQTCPRCGKLSPASEVLCGYCGTFLHMGKSSFETAKLEEESQPDSIYFGDDSTLVLMIRESNYAYRIRPQENRHDVVIGRSNGASMKPDIDLQEHNADALGVSRLHMSIRYEPKDHTVVVMDMNSANGTFLNGQKLHPREVRVVRHGDELRLGKLTMRVFFQHGTGKK
jgi:hypothetical protein